jgi:hypothetical protein
LFIISEPTYSPEVRPSGRGFGLSRWSHQDDLDSPECPLQWVVVRREAWSSTSSGVGGKPPGADEQKKGEERFALPTHSKFDGACFILLSGFSIIFIYIIIMSFHLFSGIGLGEGPIDSPTF